MTNDELVEGIEIVYDMEKNNYLMTRAIQSLEKQAASLGKKRNIVAPQKKTVADKSFDTGCMSGVCGFIVMAVLGFFVSFRVRWLGGGEFVVALIGGVLGFVLLWFIGSMSEKVEYKKKLQIAENEFVKEKEIYKEKLLKEEARIQREKEHRDYILLQKEVLEDKLYDSQNLLTSFYVTLGIDRNYRNIVPIGYMYEFARLGIARELGGDKGLYYLIMQELRWDQLQYTLQEISNKLDQIIDHQKLLYRELVDINHACHHLVENAVYSAKLLADTQKQVERTAINSEVTAYNTERCAKELEFQSFMCALNQVERNK